MCHLPCDELFQESSVGIGGTRLSGRTSRSGRPATARLETPSGALTVEAAATAATAAGDVETVSIGATGPARVTAGLTDWTVGNEAAGAGVGEFTSDFLT